MTRTPARRSSTEQARWVTQTWLHMLLTWPAWERWTKTTPDSLLSTKLRSRDTTTTFASYSSTGLTRVLKSRGPVLCMKVTHDKISPKDTIFKTISSFSAIECPSPESVRALLSFGGDILLHNYNGQTPVDLAEATARDGDPRMRDYLCNLIADLQGKVPGLRSKVTVPVRRWNVSHARDFHDPNHPESGLSMDGISTPESVCSSISRPQEEFVFEMTNHIMPPTYQLADRLGHWVILKDLKEHAKKTGQSKLASDLKNKGELVEMKKADFIKSGHSSVLDRRSIEVRSTGKEPDELVTLAKVDSVVKKILQLSEPNVVSVRSSN